MKRLIRVELWKAFHNMYFYSSLMIGLIIVLINLGENISIVSDLSKQSLESYLTGTLSGSHEGFSLFVLSLPYNGINYATRLFLFIWPVLAAMPFGWSYCLERKSGVYNQMVVRSNIFRYYSSKYLATFITGGLSVSLPIITDLLVSALVCPYAPINVTSSITSIFNGWFLSELYYTNPWLHALIWCCVCFLAGGSVACLCFIVGTKVRLGVLVVLSPFVILVIWDMLFWNLYIPLTPGYFPELLLSPLQLVTAANNLPNPAWSIILLISVMTTLGYLLGYWKVVKNELV